MRAQKNTAAFSLTELLVVVAVILILVALLIVGVQSSYSHAMDLQCRHHLEQIGHSVFMYRSANRTCWPQSWDPSTGKPWFHALAAGYLDDITVLACPSVGELPVSTRGGTPGEDVEREEADQLYKALRWLTTKQNDDGRFPRNRMFYWPQSSTGLALLAFFGFGCTDQQPAEFSDSVRRAVEYLSSSTAQYKSGADEGKFKQTGSAIYNQGICVMALSAAVQLVEDSELRNKARAAAQLGVNWMVAAAAEAEGGCFNYTQPYDSTAHPHVDLNATCWFYHGLAAARDSGLSVPQSAVDAAAGLFEHGWADHEVHGNGSAYYWFSIPNSGTGISGGTRNTPALLATRLVLGESPSSTDCQRHVGYLTKNNQPAATLLAMEARGESLTYTTYFMNAAMARVGGAPLQQWRDSFFPEHMLGLMVPDGDDMGYWPNTACHDIGGSWSSRGEWGDVYATAMACMALEAGYSDYWLTVPGMPPTATASYGYNNRLGHAKEGAAADTIVVMDYENWQIDHDDIKPDENDTLDRVALRHGGRANALMGDGRVRALLTEDILEGMWTPQPGD